MSNKVHNTPDIIFQELFSDLLQSGIWTDEKTIADAIPQAAPADILAHYRKGKNESDFNLEHFFNQYFKKSATHSTDFQSDTSRPVQAHIEVLWEVLRRAADEPVEGSSLIPLPHPYIVPGGRFNEIYYWDSYFTMLGLQVSGKVEVIENMVDNFSALIDEIGFIPNGNRSYFLSRSQPPFYAQMVELLAVERGEETFMKYLPYLEKEYAFWMNGKERMASEQEAIEHLVSLGNGETLNRYYDRKPQPRAEMYATDLETARHTDRDPAGLYADLRAACESGWDFSSRWLRDTDDLTTIHTSEIIPVDLNCLLYGLENTLAKAYTLSGNEAAARQHDQLAKNRKQLILKYCWNPETQFFHDYDFIKKENKSSFSLAAMFSLFFEIADTNQAAACARRIEKDFLKPGGLVSTPINSGQQWDAPNGWAPLQWISIQGLRNYKHQDLANQIKSNWCALNIDVYKRSGKLLEKYNVADTSLLSGGGEYPVQDGFGWTNGVLLCLLSENDDCKC